MGASRLARAILLGLIYVVNLFLALALWLCGLSGNILLGIIVIVLYRLSLWLAPIAITVLYWLPWKIKITRVKRLLFYFAHLILCSGLFVVCRLLFGNWC